MSTNNYNQNLIDFITNSPTPAHATKETIKILIKNNFTRLNESDTWKGLGQGKYFVERNNSALVAFINGNNKNNTDGFMIAGSHNDSPCLKVKPNPLKNFKNYLQIGVEIYGGPLLTTWFDRDLSLAGTVSYEDKNNKLHTVLINFKKPMAIVPSLAIHLDSNANKDKTISKQKDIPPLIGQITSGENICFSDILINQIKLEHKNIDIKNILDFDLCFYDSLPPSFIGINNEFIAGARLDNLVSNYTTLRALIETSSDHNAMIIINDHEECGSSSTVGADGPFLKSILQRLANDYETFYRLCSNSMIISCDNAHGIHPNFPEKSEENHGPIFNKGPAIKINNNQRYATTHKTSAIFQQLANVADVPYQKFISRTDMPCGSTIGPITSSNLGIKTLDVGIPTLSMHSIRELMGAKDGLYLTKILKEYFKRT